jgi:SRSO17 transposase
MDGGSSKESEARFAAYVEALGAVLGHADRIGSSRCMITAWGC